MLDGRQEVMQILHDVLLGIITANQLAKAVSLRKHMIVASAPNAILNIIYARSDESDKLEEPKLDNTTRPNGNRVETNNVRPSTQRETPFFAEPKSRQCRQKHPTANGLLGPE